MHKASFLIVLITISIFSFSLLLNVLFQGYAGYIRLTIIFSLWISTAYLLSNNHFLPKRYLRLPNRILLLLLMCLAIMLVVSATVSQAPLVAIFYSAIPYLSFYPLIYLLLIIRQNAQLTKKLLFSFIWLCNILALGVIYDGSVGLNNTPFINSKILAVLQDISTIDATGDQRGTFFFGSATSVYPFLSIGILSIILIIKVFGELKPLWFTYLSIALIWLGCFFSFSRTPLILGTIFAVYALLEVLFFHKHIKLKQKFILICLVLSLVGIASELQDFLYQQAGDYHIQRFELALSTRDTGNSHRFMVWRMGLQLFDSLEAWRGYGLGTSNIRMGQLYGFDLKPQYESSLLFTFSEGGIAGIVARLAPVIVTIHISKNTHARMLFLIWSLLFITNLFVSPLINGHSVQLAYFLGMSMCVAFAPLLSKDKTYKTKRNSINLS